MTRTRESFRRWLVCWIATAIGIGWLAAVHPSIARSADDKADAPPAASRVKAEPIAKQPLVPTTNIADIMHKGGPLMYVLALCSVIGLAFVFERFISLRRSRVIPNAFVKRFLEQVRDGSLDHERALAVCAENPSPISEVFTSAVRKWGRSAMELEQAVMDAGERVANELRKYLRVFAALHIIGPLLGLLGTVFGMITAFNAVATSEALGRPQLLAQGISQALLNTAFGLAIAIPAQSFYFYFVSRVDRLIMAMDALGQELVSSISAEGLEEKGEESRGSKSRRTAKRESEV
jgi:biopolymer transport protein ExbB